MLQMNPRVFRYDLDITEYRARSAKNRCCQNGASICFELAVLSGAFSQHERPVAGRIKPPAGRSRLPLARQDPGAVAEPVRGIGVARLNLVTAH